MSSFSDGYVLGQGEGRRWVGLSSSRITTVGVSLCVGRGHDAGAINPGWSTSQPDLRLPTPSSKSSP